MSLIHQKGDKLKSIKINWVRTGSFMPFGIHQLLLSHFHFTMKHKFFRKICRCNFQETHSRYWKCAQKKKRNKNINNIFEVNLPEEMPITHKCLGDNDCHFEPWSQLVNVLETGTLPWTVQFPIYHTYPICSKNMLQSLQLLPLLKLNSTLRKMILISLLRHCLMIPIRWTTPILKNF